MKRLLIILALFPVFVFAQTKYDIIPRPAGIHYSNDVYHLPKGWKPAKAQQVKDLSLPSEGYELSITPQGVIIKASAKEGFFYGQQTLAQIMTQQQTAGDDFLQCLTITDCPRYSYRGIMLDVVRCYIPTEKILQIIDVASQLKINRLHMHLTDDNGWRMEIKKYPKLTDIGAWRVERDTYFQNRENPRADEPTPVGGVYTQKELKTIVNYAAKRGITVIPEIEMPAHSVAAIASYPEMTCPIMGDRFIGVLPGIGGKDASIIYCAGNERVYTFLQDILDEVLKVFPSEYIHIGGDEAEKSHWQACTLCQEQMKRNGIEDEEHLQGYFMDRIIRYLNSKGRKAIGWDEVTMGHPKEDVTVFGWRGKGQAAVEDARQNGRNFVMTPGQKLYLIRYQGPQWFEPYTYFGNNTLKDVFSYEPVANDWTPQLEQQLQGIQASLWTEFCKSSDDVEYLLFPRVMALADNAWRQKDSADWDGFLRALDSFLPSLKQKGINYAHSMYNIQHTVKPADGKLSVKLECERPDVQVRYTNDGQEPTSHSDIFEGMTQTASDLSVVKAATFIGDKQVGKTLTLPFIDSKASGKNVKASSCTNGLADVLTNGLRGSDCHSDFEWAGWYNCDAEFVVDLGEPTTITQVTLGTLANCNMTVAAPRAVFVYGSNDRTNFTMLGSITLSDSQVFAKLPTRIDANVPISSSNYRYFRIKAIHPGTMPDDYLRGGQTPWLYFDEIILK